MSNKTQLQTNNTKLESLIQTLQGKAAGGGSGGGSGGGVDVCTVTIDLQPRSSSTSHYALMRYVDGEMIVEYWSGFGSKNVTFNDVICGNMIIAGIGAEIIYKNVSGTIEELNSGSNWGSSVSRVYLYKAPSASGGNGTILIRDDD